MLQVNNPSHLHSMQLDFVVISIEKVILQKNHLFQFSEILVQHRKGSGYSAAWLKWPKWREWKRLIFLDWGKVTCHLSPVTSRSGSWTALSHKRTKKSVNFHLLKMLFYLKLYSCSLGRGCSAWVAALCDGLPGGTEMGITAAITLKSLGGRS